jgi:hypothetical protein
MRGAPGQSAAVTLGGIGCQSRAPPSRNGGHRRFEIEEETRRFLLGGKAGSGPPTRTSGNGVLPGATVTELIDVDSTCVYELPLCAV